MQELNLFDPRTNIHRNVTGERLSKFFYSLSLLSPSAVLFKFIEGVEIGTKILRLKENTTACYDSKFYLYNKTAKMENIKNSVIKSLVI